MEFNAIFSLIIGIITGACVYRLVKLNFPIKTYWLVCFAGKDATGRVFIKAGCDGVTLLKAEEHLKEKYGEELNVISLVQLSKSTFLKNVKYENERNNS